MESSGGIEIGFGMRNERPMRVVGIGDRLGSTVGAAMEPVFTAAEAEVDATQEERARTFGRFFAGGASIQFSRHLIC